MHYRIKKIFVKTRRFIFEQSASHRNTRTRQCAQPLTRHQRIGVTDRCHDTGDPSVNNCIGTGWRAAMMVTRFKRYIEGCTATAQGSIIKSNNLGMRPATAVGGTYSHHAPAFYYHRAYGRIGEGIPLGRLRRIERFLHKARITI